MIQITEKLVSELIPYVKNSRTHSDEQVAQIAASIKEFGWTNPILIDGENGIIAGHGRLMAARKLGYKAVPTIELKDLTETQKKAYIIADNKLALNAGWDNEMLKLEFDDLAEMGFDLELTGFSLDEIDALEPLKVTEGLTDEDEAPPVPDEPKTKPGDIYQLGNHRLMCGDSTSIDAVDTLMAGGKADMVFTDPPYNLEENGLLKRTNKGGTANREKFGDWDVGFDPLTVIPSIVASVKKDAHVFICTSGFLFGGFTDGMIDAGAKVNYLVWCKANPMPSLAKATYVHATELIVYARFGSPAFAYPSGAHLPNYFTGNVEAHTTGHPAQKPVYVPEFCIGPASKSGHVVMDLFGGSGSTLIACEKTGRQARLMELDPKYCDVIVKRWEDFTGKKAILLTETAESVN